MHCGQNFHGGNKQLGCGAKFQWNDAIHYKSAVLEGRHAEISENNVNIDRNSWLSFESECSKCHSVIRGYRFRCIHCPEYVVCLQCEPLTHDKGHVFQIERKFKRKKFYQYCVVQ